MMEAALVIGFDDEIIYRHTPASRTSASLPDSRDLWDVIWENRERIRGIAHSHPGSGMPWPSNIDLTTFAAVEAALGRSLDWWITSSDAVALCRWQGPGRLEYTVVKWWEYAWVGELRALSRIDSLPVRPSDV